MNKIDWINRIEISKEERIKRRAIIQKIKRYKGNRRRNNDKMNRMDIMYWLEKSND
jgi:hypothetical protein